MRFAAYTAATAAFLRRARCASVGLTIFLYGFKTTFNRCRQALKLFGIEKLRGYFELCSTQPVQQLGCAGTPAGIAVKHDSGDGQYNAAGAK